MNIRLKRCLSATMVFVVLVVGIIIVSRILERKGGSDDSFFTGDQPVDVIFLGNSHMGCGVYPMELWGDYGITSYNLASPGCTIPMDYWVLVNALDYNTPDLVVLDVYDSMPGKVFATQWGVIVDRFGSFPLSLNKYRMIQDLFTDKDVTDNEGNKVYEKRWELLWNFPAFHGRWEELSEEDFQSEKYFIEESRIWKGGYFSAAIAKRIINTYSDVDDVEYDELSGEYLNRIISLCRERNIELMLINTGYDCSYESKCFHDSVHEIAKDNNIRYLDFTMGDPIICFDTDLYDAGHNTHVNFSGAEKITSYIGGVIRDNYSVQDHRGDEEYSQWNTDYKAFIQSKQNNLVNQEELSLYLLLLYDKDYEVSIEVQREHILDDDTKNLIDNITECNDSTVLHYVDKIAEKDESWIRITVYSKMDGKLVETRTF